MAGIITRTDAQRGVWKTAASPDASFSGVSAVIRTMPDA